MNLTELKTSLLKKTITAMHTLLRNYKNGIDKHMMHCPLCVVAKSNSTFTDCEKCPWSIIETRNYTFLPKCVKFKIDNGFDEDSSALRNNVNPRWSEIRILQLSKWIKLYRAELNRRGVKH